jgi:tripartite ATP-independent transporter DctM subunit
VNGEIFGYFIADQHLAIAMVVSLFVALLLGYPVAFTLGGIGLIFGYIGLDLSFFKLLPPRIWGVMCNGTLISVPLFVFMGVMLEKSGIAEDLLQAMASLFGKLRSGLAFAVIFSGALLAASTGIVGASVVTMGLISLPIMLKRGYSAELSSGVICASGTLGQIIPPSIVLILLGDIMGVSVGELFVAAVVPGLMLVGAYAAYAFIYFLFYKGPELTESEFDSLGLMHALRAMIPPGILIVAVLGSIFFGIATPTEAAAVGGFGAIILAMLGGRFTLEKLRDVLETTMHLSSMVFMILLGSQAFGLAFRGLSGDEAIQEIVLGLDSYGAVPNATLFLLSVMLLLFFLGCFLDFIEIVFIVIPILVPIVSGLGFDKLWFSILVAVNLQMSFLTPPFGFSLFYLKGVAPGEVKTGQIYRGVMPFVGIQAIVLALLIIYPGLVTWLPDLIGE